MAIHYLEIVSDDADALIGLWGAWNTDSGGARPLVRAVPVPG
jgi:hypothetical protein